MTPAPLPHPNRSLFRRLLIPGLILGTTAAVSAAAWTRPAWITQYFREKAQLRSDLVTEAVKTAPFLVSVAVQGTLDSQKNGTVINQVEGTTTIINIVPEGTKVKKGDVICELDASAIDEKLRQQSIQLTTAESAMTKATEDLKIQINQNESDTEAAKLVSELAKLDYDKYINGEYKQLQSAAAGKVEIAREAATQAEDGYEYTSRQVKKGTNQQNVADASRIKRDQAKFDLESARMELKVLEEFTQRRTVAELEAKMLESERNLKRVGITAESKTAQFEKEVTAKTLSLAVEKEKFERYTKQKEVCTLKAPQDGEVVYANLSSDSRSGRSSSSGPAIEIGATVSERQPIINLPDVTLMKVSCRIHESLIGAIRKGLAARIRVDAYSQEPFNGTVAVVSSVPMSGRWPNSDLREYDTQVYLTDDVEQVRKLRPGLTAAVEILVDNRDAVRQIPMQGVVAVSDKHMAFIVGKGHKIEQRMITIGQTNQSHVEVVKGLEDGDKVVLNPRTFFAAEIASLETKLESDKPKTLLGVTKAAADIIAAGPPVIPGAPGAGGPPGAGRGRTDPKEAFATMDKNADGSLSADELPAPMQTGFAAMDADSDGKLSMTEFVAARAKGRRSGGGGGPDGAGPPGGGSPGAGGPRGGPPTAP